MSSFKVISTNMNGLNGKRLTTKELKGQYQDKLKFLVWKVFKIRETPKDDVLLILSLHSKKKIYEVDKLKRITKRLFKSIPYVEVIERTNKNCSFYATCHSHLIVRESDYKTIKSKLTGYNIEETVVYDLDGLTEDYLIKNGRNIYEFLPPSYHIPKDAIAKVITPVVKTIDETISILVKIVTQPIQQLKSKIITVVKKIIDKSILPGWKLNFNNHILKQIVNDT